MQERPTMANKEKGEWQTTTLAEWKASDSVIWRAQTSTSPDGKKFIGVRQYIKTKAKEIPGKGGITLLNDVKGKAALIELTKLFQSLSGSKKQTEKRLAASNSGEEGDALVEEKKPRKSKKAVEVEEPATFGLINADETKWLIRWRSDDGLIKTKSTETEEDAKTFDTEEEAGAYLKQAVKIGLKSTWRVVRLD